MCQINGSTCSWACILIFRRSVGYLNGGSSCRIISWDGVFGSPHTDNLMGLTKPETKNPAIAPDKSFVEWLSFVEIILLIGSYMPIFPPIFRLKPPA